MTGTLVLLLIFLNVISLQEKTSAPPVTIMFYNVENLFDTFDDPVKDDNEFLPSGLRRWSKSRYIKKLNSVFKTIAAAGEWNLPAIVAFCEVENRSVLNDLTNNTLLERADYGIIHEDSPDARGIDVCMIYRKEIVRILSYDYFVPETPDGNFNSRSILYAKCCIVSDTIHLFVNHWPSRRGGVLAGEDMRISISGKVREVADSIQYRSKGAKIMIIGDFNCTPNDRAMLELTDPATEAGRDKDLTLINLSGLLSSSGPEGTYNYRGTWEMLDQVIVSRSLLECREGLFTRPDLLRIFKPDFLLRSDSRFPGLTTFSTYYGYRYQGGFSDHLPVLIDLVQK